MTNIKQNLLFIAALVAIFGFLAYATFSDKVHADATQVAATVATTSVSLVGTTPILVFATSTCASRTISTTASPIMIGFTDAQGFVPSGVSGFLQGASTTVSYDGDKFGCKTLRVYSFVSGTITVQESR